MNPLVTLEPPTHSTLQRTILAQDGIAATVLAFAPGDETAPAANPEPQLLFVIDGEITVRSGELNTMLHKENALLLSPGQEYAIQVQAGSQAKLLRVTLPARPANEPVLHTFQP